MLGSLFGMHFESFLTLAVISLIAAFSVHYLIRYRILEGFDGFLWKWVVGWVGAWLGTPVLGDWFHGVSISNIYIIPAFLGAFIGAFVATFVWKAEVSVLRSRLTS
jgi:uncharacterized membrane protein YeaQ/YmgE (transglycosylase-associated protein family)